MLAIGWIPSIAIIIMAAGEIAIGHFLGGESQEKRSALATACVARNVGLAIYLASLSDFGQYYVPTIMAYMLLGAIVALPYAFWSRKQIQLRKTS
jgi:BASS family bile acid:Na+ symporter